MSERQANYEMLNSGGQMGSFQTIMPAISFGILPLSNILWEVNIEEILL
jgi:hypothetical protein